MSVTTRTVLLGDQQWVFTVIDKIDVEFVLEHQMHSYLDGVKAGKIDLRPVPRELKEALLKEGRRTL